MLKYFVSVLLIIVAFSGCASSTGSVYLDTFKESYKALIEKPSVEKASNRASTAIGMYKTNEAILKDLSIEDINWITKLTITDINNIEIEIKNEINNLLQNDPYFSTEYNTDDIFSKLSPLEKRLYFRLVTLYSFNNQSIKEIYKLSSKLKNLTKFKNFELKNEYIRNNQNDNILSTIFSYFSPDHQDKVINAYTEYETTELKYVSIDTEIEINEIIVDGKKYREKRKNFALKKIAKLQPQLDKLSQKRKFLKENFTKVWTLAMNDIRNKRFSNIDIQNAKSIRLAMKLFENTTTQSFALLNITYLSLANSIHDYDQELAILQKTGNSKRIRRLKKSRTTLYPAVFMGRTLNSLHDNLATKIKDLTALVSPSE